MYIAVVGSVGCVVRMPVCGRWPILWIAHGSHGVNRIELSVRTVTLLPCAQLDVPPRAMFSHMNSSELQVHFRESPGPNHSDQWRVTFYRSKLLIFTDSPFCGSQRISSCYATICPALWILRWLSFRDWRGVLFTLLFLAPFFMFLFSSLIPRPISSPTFQLHFYHRPFFFHQPLFLLHLQLRC
jgi:hypothetical protein